MARTKLIRWHTSSTKNKPKPATAKSLPVQGLTDDQMAALVDAIWHSGGEDSDLLNERNMLTLQARVLIRYLHDGLPNLPPRYIATCFNTHVNAINRVLENIYNRHSDETEEMEDAPMDNGRLAAIYNFIEEYKHNQDAGSCPGKDSVSTYHQSVKNNQPSTPTRTPKAKTNRSQAPSPSTPTTVSKKPRCIPAADVSPVVTPTKRAKTAVTPAASQVPPSPSPEAKRIGKFFKRIYRRRPEFVEELVEGGFRVKHLLKLREMEKLDIIRFMQKLTYLPSQLKKYELKLEFFASLIVLKKGDKEIWKKICKE